MAFARLGDVRGSRVFAVTALSVLATAAGSFFVPAGAVGLLVWVAAGTGVALVWRDPRAPAWQQVVFALLVVLCAGAGWGRGHLRGVAPRAGGADWPAGDTVTGWVQGRVRERPEARPGGWRVFLAVERSTLPRVSDGVLCLRISGATGQPRFDARLEAFVEVERPLEKRTPGGFDARRWLGSHGAHLWGRVRGSAWREVAPPRQRPAVYLAAWRDRLAERIRRPLPGEAGGLLRGLLLGERDAVRPEAMEEFRRAGVLHLLALSGQHVSLIAILLLAALRGRGLAPAPLAGIVGAGIWIYVFLTGASPSVVRAGLGATVALAGRAMCRRVHSMTALAWSALLGPLIEPRLLGDVGFQLSCLASAGLVVAAHWGGAARFADPLWQGTAGTASAVPVAVRVVDRAVRSAVHFVAGLWSATLSAQLAVLPLLAHHFGVISAVGLLSNLLLVPLSSLLLALGLPLLAVDGLAPVPDAIWRPLGVGGAAVLRLGAWFAAWPKGELTCSLGGVAAALTLAALGLAAVLGAPFRRRSGARVAHLEFSNAPFGARPSAAASLRAGGAVAACGLWLGFAAASLVPAPAAPRALVEYWVLEVGQGDAQVVEFADGYTLVVDTGDAGDGRDAARRVLVPFLRARGRSAVSEVVLTHEDRDHAGGWPTLARDLGVGVVSSGAGTLAALRERGHLAGFGGRCRAVVRGDILRRGAGYRIRVLWPPPPGTHVPERANDRSVVLVVEAGDEALLLTGDADSTVEAHWTDLPSGVRTGLKLGHHGSRSSSGVAFLERLRPAWAVCSSGRRNRFGHPHTETLERLARRGVPIDRTDELGTVHRMLGGPPPRLESLRRPTPVL